jgi:microcystin-dependent protein
MGQPYVGEIRMFAGNFAPNGWALCQGQVLSIAQNDVLFNLIGTTYGGDGQTTFNLPNLGSRVPIHQGSGYVIGQAAGTESVTLTQQQMPQHNHPVACNSASSSSPAPAGTYFGATSSYAYDLGAAANASMSPATVGFTGGNQPHDNLMPYVAINFIISLFGVYPSQT